MRPLVRTTLVSLLLAASAAAGCVASETASLTPACGDGLVPAPAPAPAPASAPASGAAGSVGAECLPYAPECVEDGSGLLTQTFLCATGVASGEATLRYDLMGVGGVLVEVRDGAGEVAHREVFSMPTTGELQLSGSAGFWSMRVDYYDAHGWSRLALSS